MSLPDVPMAPADALAARLLSRFPPGPAYTVEALRRDGFPRALTHFIEQALQRRLAMEREVLDAARAGARSPWFDAGAPAVQEAWDAYFDALSATACVPADEWPHALRQAARQVTAYLLRPATALVGFVFADEQGSLPADVVLRRMRYFAAYPYLHDVVRAYVRDKHLETLDRKGFASLLARLEAHAAERYQGEAWGQILADLFETLGEGSPPAISGALLAPLFADKGLHDEARRLAAAPSPLTRDAVVRLLGGAPSAPAADLPPAAPRAPEPVAQPPDQIEDPAMPEASRGEATGAPSAEAPDAPSAHAAPEAPSPPAQVRPASRAVRPMLLPDDLLGPVPPREMRPAPHRSPEEDVPPPPRPRAPEHAAPAEERRPLWQRVMGGRRDASEAAPDTDGLAALEARALGALAPAQRQTIVRQVFGGDAAAYAGALQRLAATTSWTEAARTLLTVFEERGVDLYAPAAIALTDAAEQRFL